MKEKILTLKKLGKSYTEICNEIGCSKSTVSYYCSPNGKEKNRNRTNKERKNLRDEIKMEYGGKCQICGYNRCFRSLTFHHKDPSIKEDKVSFLINSKGKSAAYAEAKKCVLVCSNCHGEIHDGIITI
jgi:predicted HNH restriction endonuclease